MESKSIKFEVKDIDKSTRTIINRYAVFNNKDRDKDISRKGMTLKSVTESFDDVRFFLNHEKTQAPGVPVKMWEQEDGAYSESKCGTHTLGNDVLIMADEGIIKAASFGYEVVKSNKMADGIRELKEVKVWEYSLLTHWGANPLAGPTSVTKEFNPVSFVKSLSTTEQDVFLQLVQGDNMAIQQLVELWLSLDTSSDLYSWLGWHISRRIEITQSIRSELKWNPAEVTALKSHIVTMEKFCRNTNASDDCIKQVQKEIKNAKLFLVELDTATTEPITQPGVSDLKELASVFDKFIHK